MCINRTFTRSYGRIFFMKKLILAVLSIIILPFNVTGQTYPDEDCPSNIYLYCSAEWNDDKFYIHLFMGKSEWGNTLTGKNEIIAMRQGIEDKITSGKHYCKAEPQGSVIRLYSDGVLNRETGKYEPDIYTAVFCKESSKRDFDYKKNRILESIKKQKEYDEKQKKMKEQKKKF